MKRGFILIPGYFLLLGLWSFMQKNKTITYLPLGDSYTICTGATAGESWPVLLTGDLQKEKIATRLLDNPARNGYSSQDLIDRELGLVKKLKPDFITLLIGVNDWVRRVPKETFAKNLTFILDECQAALRVKKNIVLITIPDFALTPQGRNYSGGRDISKGISEFNEIIILEARKRGLGLADIFGVSQQMKDNPDLVSADGLHPSAREYAIWEKIILAESLKVLK